MNLHNVMCATFGSNRSSSLVAFPEFVLSLVRLLAAVRAVSRKTREKTTFIHLKLEFRPENYNINVTNFVYNNFLAFSGR